MGALGLQQIAGFAGDHEFFAGVDDQYPGA
jgi:hypothetical protein